MEHRPRHNISLAHYAYMGLLMVYVFLEKNRFQRKRISRDL